MPAQGKQGRAPPTHRERERASLLVSLLVVPWFWIWQNASEVSFCFVSLLPSLPLPFLSAMLFRFCFCCCFVIVNHRNVSSVCECVCVCLLGGSLGFVVSTHKIYIAFLLLFLSSPLCSQFSPISDFCAILRAFVSSLFFCGPLTWPELFEVPAPSLPNDLNTVRIANHLQICSGCSLSLSPSPPRTCR